MKVSPDVVEKQAIPRDDVGLTSDTNIATEQPSVLDEPASPAPSQFEGLFCLKIPSVLTSTNHMLTAGVLRAALQAIMG